MYVVLLALLAAVVSAQTVTDTQWVSVGKNRELLRKINGRWWTQDNREVFPPSRTGVFWEIDSDPGVVEFFHHNPADLSRAEALHLFMTIPQVESVMGKPNRIFRMGPNGGMWMYYGENGVMLQVRIMEGELGEANYKPAKGDPWPVASVAADLGGRSIYKVRAERATQRSREELDRMRAEALAGRDPRRSQQPAAVSQPQAYTPPPEKHIVQREALAAIKAGMPREDVLAALGEPTSKFSMTTGEGVRETLRYHLPDGSPVDIRLAGGKVAQVP